MELQRYSYDILFGFDIDNENGEWVRFEDVEHLLKQPLTLSGEPVTMDEVTPIRQYVSGYVPIESIADDWTKGYEECKRRIHLMFEQPINNRRSLAECRAHVAPLLVEIDRHAAELADLRNSMAYRTSMIGRTIAELDTLKAQSEDMERKQHTMSSVMEAVQSIPCMPMLTTNQCHALAQKLNSL